MKKLNYHEKFVYTLMIIGTLIVFLTDDIPLTIFGLEFLFFALGYVIYADYKDRKKRRYEHGIWC